MIRVFNPAIQMREKKIYPNDVRHPQYTQMRTCLHCDHKYPLDKSTLHRILPQTSFHEAHQVKLNLRSRTMWGMDTDMCEDFMKFYFVPEYNELDLQQVEFCAENGRVICPPCPVTAEV